MESLRMPTPIRPSTPHSHIPRPTTPGSIPSRPSTPRRSKTPRIIEFESMANSPWQHMAQTYAWVLEQEFLELMKHARAQGTATQWSWEQQVAHAERRERAKAEERQRLWEEMSVGIEEQAERWIAQEEARRVAAAKEAEKTRVVQEEIRRLQFRDEMRREEERRRIAEERWRAQEDKQDRERKTREKGDREMLAAWKRYEARWAALLKPGTTAVEQLTFRTICWPMVKAPGSVEDITPAQIAMFLLSPLHSSGISRKDRIREALRRWHPDRFRPRLLGRVVEVDRDAVEEAVGVVARILNDLMAREASISHTSAHR